MSIAVLDKAFCVLEVLARTGRALSLTELAEESRLPKPTVHRILNSLKDLGYVVPGEARGSYGLSDRLNSLREQGRDGALRHKAAPLLAELHERFDETVNLGVLEGIYVRYAQVQETEQALRWIVKPGARDLFHTTAMGRAIVAQLPAEQQSRLVAKAAATYPVRGRAARRRELEAELTKTKRRGWASEEEETVAGVACVAVSLDAWDEPLAGISVAVPVNRFPRKLRSELAAAMRQIGFGATLSVHRASA